MAIERYETDLSQLTKRCEEMRKLYTDILVIPELLFQYLVLCCPGRRMARKPRLCGDWPFSAYLREGGMDFSPAIPQGYKGFSFVP